MKNIVVLLSLFLVTSSAMSQMERYVELSVTETVTLNAESAVLKVTLVDYYFEENYYLEDYDYEEDAEYYRLKEESPKKVTKEMEKAFEERQKNREVRDLEIEASRIENEKERSKALLTCASELNALGFTYSMTKEESVGYEYEYESEYEVSGVKDVILVTVNSEAEYQKIIEMTNNSQLMVENSTINYEKISTKLESILPQLSARAKTEGEIIAKSLNKKLGNVLNVSNLMPSGSYASSYLEDLYISMRSLGYGDRSEINQSPFQETKTSTLTYVYRFALLD